MAAPGAVLLSPARPTPRPTASTQGGATLQDRLRRWLRRAPKAAGQTPAASGDPLQNAGQLLRARREERGLSLRELALETRISTPVLEALERGWRDRLPEPAYLRTMLPLIERHLDLPAGSLLVLLPSDQPARLNPRSSLLQRFTPGSIEVFSSWQGTVLYGGLTLALIYGLNLQQRQLAVSGQLSLQPIPAAPTEPPQAGKGKGAASNGDGAQAALLAALPELRPLEHWSNKAALATAMAALQPTQPPARPPLRSSGVLVLRLDRASRVLLRSGNGTRSELQGVQGELVLPISGGVQLEVQPAPKPGPNGPAVEWNGEMLPPLPGKPEGRYAVGEAAAARP